MKIEFKGISNPRLYNGDLGFNWCDKCGGRDSALVMITRRENDDTFRLCKKCIVEAENIINKTILQDVLDKAKLPRFPDREKRIKGD
jgi:hypothetical protein